MNMKKKTWFVLSFLFFGNAAFAECSTFPPYWCDDGTYAENLMDAIQQNNLEAAEAQMQQQKQLAAQKRQLAIQENLKWLNDSEGKAYVAVTQAAAEGGQACVTKTLMRSMFSNRPPSRGGQADAVCQQSAHDSLTENRYESLVYYRKANRIRPMRKGVDNPDSQEAVAARDYLSKRFEADLLTLPVGSREEASALNASTEANAKLCADQGDALACHEMVMKPFAAAFKELFGNLKRNK